MFRRTTLIIQVFFPHKGLLAQWQGGSGKGPLTQVNTAFINKDAKFFFLS